MVNSLHGLLSRAAPGSICLIDISQRRALTYGQLTQKTKGLSRHLREKYDLKKGDRVCLFLPNSWQFVAAFYGAVRLGCLAVPVDFRSSPLELKFCVDDSGASCLVCDSSKTGASPLPGERTLAVDTSGGEDLPDSSKKEPEAEVSSSDPACILYTGGTTGPPKGAVLTHSNFIAVLSGLAQSWQTRQSGEVFAQFLPMTHSGGINCNLNSAIFCRGKTVIMRRFDAANLLEIVEGHGVTAFAGVPTAYTMLVNSGQMRSRDLHSLRVCFSSGSALVPAIAERFRELTGITVNVGWGLTEASPQLTVCPLGRYAPNYVGLPLPGTEIMAFDDSGKPLPEGSTGELGAKGPQVMLGYWNNEDETRKAFAKTGHLLTGDLGYVAPEGVYLLGRKKSVINSGGYKVWPDEVERIILEHEKVKEAAVIGVQDDLYGEVVRAYVVSKGRVSASELREFCKQRLSSYKVPREFLFRESLPKSSVGKILHRVLREED